ncbi:phage tail protein [Photobacterium leiognathi]|uniref:phage tail protein n=1 Tax=Photobacterium leiognathi TaxID=553611 RepID=UPI000D15D1A6|nr:phage tail protein [Photobacterium leiognathi]PSW53019.1 phage tail protein [Photobacterium leiognathi subsp. mandapamensis]
MTQQIPDPATYAKLPAGTRMLWGALDAETANLKLLKDADAVGVTGKSASFIECGRLIDTSKKYMADLPEGPDKEFVFLDDPSDADLLAFLAAAEAGETVKVRIEFPNKRWADMVIVLGGWSMQELDKGAPMKLVVNGKQNDIQRGITAPAA